MSGEETSLQGLQPAQLQELVERLAQSEAALQAVLTNQIDAVIDPATATPILLRRAQETLRESEERFRLLIDGIKDFALFMLDAEGLVIGWNAAAERIFGYTAADVTGRHFSCFYPADAGASVTPESSLKEAGEGRFEGEMLQVRRDGSTFWANVVISPLFDAQGGRRGFAVVTRDITEQRRAGERTAFQARVLAEVQDATVAVDTDSRVSYWNEAAERLYGLSADAALGRPLEEATHPRWQRPEDEQAARAALASTGVWQGESIHTARNGREMIVESSVSVMHDASGARSGTLAVIRDVTERKALEEQLRQRALFDTLTSLPNRALFMDRLGHACSSARRYQSCVAVLFLDLDGFKFVNDSLGHTVGDQLLTVVGHRLADNLRMGDTAARYGGDEFTILLEDVTGRDEAVRVAERIIHDLHRPFFLNGRSRFITASIGIALGTPSADETQPDRLIRHADIALHQAKIAGKARVRVFEPGMARQAVERLELETDLRWALERNEFRLHYQPIVGLNSGAVVGMEALVRWHHPRRGLVQPMEFIPLAEETGLIVPLGRWILEEACAQAATWEAAGPNRPAPTVSTNLSVLELQQPDLVEQVRRVLRTTGLDPARLELEITEGAAMQDAEATVATLRALKGLGMQLAIDDFGTGYSSLSYLRQFPLDTIKVDQSFVSAVDNDMASETIVEGVVALAHALGLDVTAEGIEKPEQLARLQTLHCDFGQGFYFSHPMPKDALKAFYHARLPMSVH